MKIHATDYNSMDTDNVSNKLDNGVKTPQAIRIDKGTHMAESGTGISDESVTLMVKSHLAAIKLHHEGCELLRREEEARGWMARLFPNRKNTPSPLPSPLPTYIVARARELGLIK
jgi:hypothetical protein